MALAPAIIRWGPDASSDVLRRRARCSKCGHKGATLQIPGWVGGEIGVAPFPIPDRQGRPNLALAAWHFPERPPQFLVSLEASAIDANSASSGEPSMQPSSSSERFTKSACIASAALVSCATNSAEFADCSSSWV